MTDVTAAPPAKMQQAMQSLDKSSHVEATLACAACRERHGGWCIDELWPSAEAECPLAGLAPTIQVGHKGLIEPDAK